MIHDTAVNAAGAEGRGGARQTGKTRRVGMSVEDKRSRAAEFDWYHTIDLGDGVVTDGHYDHRSLLGGYRLPDDLAGTSALDVGPAHGFFAFELEARGADPVVTVELPRWSAHDASPRAEGRLRARGPRQVTEATSTVRWRSRSRRR